MPEAGSLGFGGGQSHAAPGGQAKVNPTAAPADSTDPAQPTLPAKEKTWIERNWYLVLPGAVLVSAVMVADAPQAGISHLLL